MEQEREPFKQQVKIEYTKVTKSHMPLSGSTRNVLLFIQLSVTRWTHPLYYDT